MSTKTYIEKWGIYEIKFVSNTKFSSPFQDVKIMAVFRKDTIIKKIEGFYDGNSTWKIRFMPEDAGSYSFDVISNHIEFDGRKGSFECMEAKAGNHGPLKVEGASHFSYADGIPFFVMGTTAYAWTYRPDAVRQKSLESFSKYRFNKIRMLVFPKNYVTGEADVDVSYDPLVYPFEGEPMHFDFKAPVPEYFRNFEDRVMDLMKLGIEADVILFHPYDKWGIDWGHMSQDDDLFYVKYIIARLSAYRNVWWSLANEYDVNTNHEGNSAINDKRKDWDLLGSYVKANDPYGHLLSIHNLPFGKVYPDRDWLTHVSYQHPDTYTLLLELKAAYHKPVINDEYSYEGNVKYDWGNSSAEMTVMKHWLTVMAGGYGTHGEVFIMNDNHKDLFWSYGGTIVGESAQRLKYMKEIIEACPYQEMKRDHINTDGHHYFSLSKGTEFYLIFCRYDLPSKRIWYGPRDGSSPKYQAVIYDVWNCEIKIELTVEFGHIFSIDQWTAIKLIRS